MLNVLSYAEQYKCKKQTNKQTKNHHHHQQQQQTKSHTPANKQKQHKCIINIWRKNKTYLLIAMLKSLKHNMNKEAFRLYKQADIWGSVCYFGSDFVTVFHVTCGG